MNECGQKNEKKSLIAFLCSLRDLVHGMWTMCKKMINFLICVQCTLCYLSTIFLGHTGADTNGNRFAKPNNYPLTPKFLFFLIANLFSFCVTTPLETEVFLKTLI